MGDDWRKAVTTVGWLRILDPDGNEIASWHSGPTGELSGDNNYGYESVPRVGELIDPGDLVVDETKDYKIWLQVTEVVWKLQPKLEVTVYTSRTTRGISL